MTIDEAIKHAEETAYNLEQEAECIRSWGKENDTKQGAINCEKYAEEHRQLAGWLKDYKRLLEQEPTDAINRQDVIDQTYLWSKDEFLRVTNPFDYLRKRINSLPPVTPQPKMGHCEECKHFRKLPYHIDILGKCICHTGFCPRGDWYCADYEPEERSDKE